MKKPLALLIYLFLIEIISWFIFINKEVFFIYNFWKLYYMTIFWISVLFLLLVLVFTYKKINTFKKTELLKPLLIFTIISISFYLITWNVTFNTSSFNEDYKKINIDAQTMYLPENYLDWKKTDKGKLEYIYDLHLYNLEDLSSFINIPFLVNYQVIINYDKSSHYNLLYNPVGVNIRYPLISKYFYNNIRIHQYEEWKSDFYIDMEKKINEYFN